MEDTVNSPSAEVLDFSESRAAKQQHQKIVDWTKQQFTAIKNARTITEQIGRAHV